MADVTSLKGVAEKDRQMVEGVQAMFGPEPATMGFAKNLFWGRIREELLFPYMTENLIERIFRDSRINSIVEGTNEVIRCFIFGYGGKQLAEHMLGVQQAIGWNHDESVARNLERIGHGITRPGVMKAAAPLGAELFLGQLPAATKLPEVDSSLRPRAQVLADLVREHSHHFKLAAKQYAEKIVSYQAVQARLADSAIWLHAYACTLSKLDRDTRRGASGLRFEQDQAAAHYFMDLAARQIRRRLSDALENDDEAMRQAAAAALRYSDSLPNERFIIPESSPVAKGTGRAPAGDGVKV